MRPSFLHPHAYFFLLSQAFSIFESSDHELFSSRLVRACPMRFCFLLLSAFSACFMPSLPLHTSLFSLFPLVFSLIGPQMMRVGPRLHLWKMPRHSEGTFNAAPVSSPTRPRLRREPPCAKHPLVQFCTVPHLREAPSLASHDEHQASLTCM